MQGADRSATPDLRRTIIWNRLDGSVVACFEKIKVLCKNLEELCQMAQDAFEYALLVECEENLIREAFLDVISRLENHCLNS